MIRHVLIATILMLACALPAEADTMAIVKAHSDAFQKAATSCNLPAALELYEKNATLIWPGEGEVAQGRRAIEKVLKSYCTGNSRLSLRAISSQSQAIGPDYIINVGMWDFVGNDGKTARVRTTELLHKSGGKWRYAIDHASIGLPPPTAPQGAATASKRQRVALSNGTIP